MSLDTALRKVAQSVVSKFGTAAALRRVTGTKYSTTTRTMTPVTTDTPLKIRLDDYQDREIRGNIKVGDRKGTIAAADVDEAPTLDDNVVIGERVYDIVNVESLIATDLAATFVLQLRG